MTLHHELLATGGDATPIYMRLAAILREKVRRGEFTVGAALPSERDMAETMAVSRVTVRKAIDLLMREGVLSRRQGSGTYVAPRIEQPSSMLAGFTEDLRRRGLSAGSDWLEKSTDIASPDEVIAFGLPVNARVQRFRRIRTADGEPLALEHATVPETCLPDPAAVVSSLYAALDAIGRKPVTGLQRVTASLATEEEAQHLGVPTGAAVLRIERRGYLADGTMVELTRSAYRGDRYDFVSELREI
ncbi:MAG: GntR family transcriptional regulator [Rhodobacteraceae bacterium]|nr:GntR family transcriptional regulator [Paracoccaceae bacterium]TVR45826.1 MAG: GntR family transcriptional regulator [Paracoccaceae bacterium]